MTHKLVIANTLKPVDDVRAYEKIAQTLAKTNKYEVNIIGNLGKKESNNPSIKFWEHSISRKSLFSRLIQRERILFRILKLRPAILIITTHELLNIGIWAKLICRSKVIYDVQEDYLKNLSYLSAKPKLISSLLGRLIRLNERIASPFINLFLLAEKCYLYEIKFPASRSIIIENKATSMIARKKERKTSTINFLFSGTISYYSEVIVAIKTYQTIAKEMANTTLQIIGQYHDEELAAELKSVGENDASIKLNVSSEPISHTLICDAIFDSHCGIISYQEDEVNKNKIPTKLYEYARYELPYLIQKSTNWKQKSERLGGGIPIDFLNLDVSLISFKLENPQELFHSHFPENETWESQELELNNSINSLLNSQ